MINWKTTDKLEINISQLRDKNVILIINLSKIYQYQEEIKYYGTIWSSKSGRES